MTSTLLHTFAYVFLKPVTFFIQSPHIGYKQKLPNLYNHHPTARKHLPSNRILINPDSSHPPRRAEASVTTSTSTHDSLPKNVPIRANSLE